MEKDIWAAPWTVGDNGEILTAEGIHVAQMVGVCGTWADEVWQKQAYKIVDAVNARHLEPARVHIDPKTAPKPWTPPKQADAA